MLWVPIIHVIQFYCQICNDCVRRRGEFLLYKYRRQITAEFVTMTMCADLESGQREASQR